MGRLGAPILDALGAPVFVILEARVVGAAPDDPLAVEVPFPPADGRDVWDGEKYIPHIEPATQPDMGTLVSLLVKRGVISPADIAAEIGLKG